MVAVGLLLIVLGALAIVATIFVNDGDGGSILGMDLSVTTIFFFGVAVGAAIIWGYSIMKWGTKRGLAHRKERRELDKLSNRLGDRLDHTEPAPPRDQGTTSPPPAPPS